MPRFVSCLGSCALAAFLTLTAAPCGAQLWSEQILHVFSGAEGTAPSVPVVLNGRIYGTTSAGGLHSGNCALTTGGGTVFALDPPAARTGAWKATVLHAFTCGADGQAPTGPPASGPGGRLYGMTGYAGPGDTNGGTIYELTPPAGGAAAWSFRVISTFDYLVDGSPVGSLLADTHGNFYGATTQSVFELSPPQAGASAWTRTVLQAFPGGVNGGSPPGGSAPTGALIADANGNIDGTTQSGGATGGYCYGGCGVVFRLSPPLRGKPGWTETVLYAFTGPDGYSPGGLVLGSRGVLYGTASYVVYALQPPAGAHAAWTESVIANIQSVEGGLALAPAGSPRAPPGTLYGSTMFGEPFVESVFSLVRPAVPGPWTLGYVHIFGQTDGLAGVGAAGPGTLLGVAANTVFALNDVTAPPPWHESTIAVRPAGGDPNAPLSEDARGVLYGTTPNGGAYASGAVYELTRASATLGSWLQRVVYSFGAQPDAQTPNGGILPGPSGELYGTTSVTGGCRANVACGTVYELTLPSRIRPGLASAGWAKRVLYAFSGRADGGQPASSVIADSRGALYGTTSAGGAVVPGACSPGCGTIFKLTPPGQGRSVWTESVLHAFAGPDGAGPAGPLIADASGALYGTTARGGSANFGTVFRLAPPRAPGAGWSFSTLHAFTIGADGNPPNDRLVMDANGNLFGTSRQDNATGGGLNLGCPPTGCGGIVFELARGAGTAPWTFRTLYPFIVVADGSSPVPGSVAIDAQGRLYGTTQIGGAPGLIASGSVVRLTPPRAPQTQWTEQDLYDFPAGAVGLPASGLLVDRFGTLIGVAGFEQCPTCGRVFELAPP